MKNIKNRKNRKNFKGQKYQYPDFRDCLCIKKYIFIFCLKYFSSFIYQLVIELQLGQTGNVVTFIFNLEKHISFFNLISTFTSILCFMVAAGTLEFPRRGSIKEYLIHQSIEHGNKIQICASLDCVPFYSVLPLSTSTQLGERTNQAKKKKRLKVRGGIVKMLMCIKIALFPIIIRTCMQKPMIFCSI